MERAKGNDRVNYPRELEECKTQRGYRQLELLTDFGEKNPIHYMHKFVVKSFSPFHKILQDTLYMY